MGADTMTKDEALHKFWNSFGIPAYDVNTVPDDAELPYITYEVREGSLDDDIVLTASLWYFGMSWTEISAKADEISQYIGQGGASQKYDGGRLWIRRETSFIQRMSEPSNDSIRRIVLSVIAEYQSAD